MSVNCVPLCRYIELEILIISNNFIICPSFSRHSIRYTSKGVQNNPKNEICVVCVFDASSSRKCQWNVNEFYGCYIYEAVSFTFIHFIHFYVDVIGVLRVRYIFESTALWRKKNQFCHIQNQHAYENRYSHAWVMNGFVV